MLGKAVTPCCLRVAVGAVLGILLYATFDWPAPVPWPAPVALPAPVPWPTADGFLQTNFLSAGHWQKTIILEWVSEHPGWRWMDIGSVQRCLKNKSLLIFGDSHMRNTLHDLAFMLHYGDTHRLPDTNSLLAHGPTIHPPELQHLEQQQEYTQGSPYANPCSYSASRELKLEQQIVAKFVFLPGSCCLSRRGLDWLFTRASALWKPPDAIIYGATSPWDYARFFSTEDKFCKRLDDTPDSFTRRGSAWALATLKQYVQWLSVEPLVLYRSAWAPDFEMQPFSIDKNGTWVNEQRRNMNEFLEKVENAAMLDNFPQSVWMHFSLFFAKYSQMHPGQSHPWQADDSGHALPEVQRSVTMSLLNSLCH
eukprot:TRINITY_DN25087_c0_g1_i1.p1 TRINITY_DN25087_c0_g1~~TRINITY_DN25087_c0_g1_i1.p1  ORF type:complete len:365 (-),score=37.93 TRINITY_DN25087_c0_g1_i1:35-1129(-)